MDREKWERLAREVFSGMQDWRVQNPRATFAEIEDTVDEKLADLRVKMMEDVALESKAKDLRALQEGEQIGCTICGGALKDRGKHVRELTTQHEKQIHLERSYGYCPTCLVGFFPPGRGIGIATEGKVYPENAGGDGEAGNVDAISASESRTGVFHQSRGE
ncbi:MAG: hypothetical protein ACHQT8_07470 [Chlamydiales bacterium]